MSEARKQNRCKPYLTLNITTIMEMTAFVQEVINLTNQFRISNGVDPLSVDIDLTESAQQHSENMALQDFFDHTDPNGLRSVDRAENAGYETGFVGENIGAGYRTPQDVVNGWINSPGHRDNMLNAEYNEIGVGYFFLEDDTGSFTYQSYWTQVFGRGEIESPEPTFELPDSVIGPSAPEIDPLQYGASYSDLIVAFGNNADALLNHYSTAGQFEGRSPDLFDEVSYLASHSDLLIAFGSDTTAATQHYLQHGYFEGRAIDSFDEARYIASNTDLIQAFGYDVLQAATHHYVSYGFSEQRSTTAFDAASYLNNHDDLRAAFGDDLNAATQHYIVHGYDEGRSWI